MTYKSTGLYASPPDSASPFKGDVDKSGGVEASIPLYIPKPVTEYTHTGLIRVLDADGLDKGRDLDLPAPVKPMIIPGLVGELVQACWDGAPYQIAEVAIASALSTMSLLCSRVYRHGTLGLSLYLLVLAKTSTGKSFAFTANDRWFTELQKFFEQIKPPHYEEAKKRLAAARKMIIGEIGSAQGLAQHMPDSPSTLFHADEYVEHIKLMSQSNPPAHIAQTRAELLRLMEMSGPGRIYRGRKYSKRSNGPEEVDVLMASLSILATGTPEAFYNDISSDLLTSGFLPRFTILEYSGNITAQNEKIKTQLSKSLMDGITTLFNQSYTKGQTLTGTIEEIIDVQPADYKAISKLRWFENVCIRSSIEANDKDLPTGGIWSRAKEHVKQIACLIAIGVNPYNPKIEDLHAELAIKIVLPSVEKITGKFISGEIGMSDDRRQAEIRKFIAKLFVGGKSKFSKFPGVKPELLEAGIIQAYVVRNYCRLLKPFKEHALGSTRAFNDAWNDMLRYGELYRAEVGDGRVDSCVTLNFDVFGPIIKLFKDGDL